MPTLKSLWQWAEKWVPEDPEMVKREPELVAALPGWFLPVERDQDARSHLSLPEPELAIEAAR